MQIDEESSILLNSFKQSRDDADLAESSALAHVRPMKPSLDTNPIVDTLKVRSSWNQLVGQQHR